MREGRTSESRLHSHRPLPYLNPVLREKQESSCAEQGPWREGLESGAGPATLQPCLTASCSVWQSGRGAEEGSGWGGWGRVLQALASASVCHCPSRGRGWSL